jgi:hypothetical protein
VLVEGLVSDRYLEQGCVAVLLKFKNCFATVAVDDFLPCVDMEPLYAKAKSGSLWCSFVEKALAKFLGGYSQICSFPGYETHEGDIEPYLGFVSNHTVGDILNMLLPIPT